MAINKLGNFLLWGLVLFSCTLTAQNRKELERQNKRLKLEIRKLNSQLIDTKKKSNNTLTKLQLLGKRMKKREKLIRNLDLELKEINKEIITQSANIGRLENRLQDTKADYAKHIQSYYKQFFLDKSFWAQVLFSDDFNSIYKKRKYLTYGLMHREIAGERLAFEQQNLKERASQLDKQKRAKSTSIRQITIESDKIAKERKLKRRYIKKLQSQQKSIEKNLRLKQIESQKLQARITAIIEEEIRKSKLNKSNKLRDAKINKAFERKKRKFKPPVKGPIVNTFGVHPHPVVKSVKISNNGIDIATTKSQLAKVIYKGQVTSIFLSTNLQTASVIVKHGSYYTVYSNLVHISVKKGQAVKTGEKIGKVHKSYDGRYIFHFQIWKNKEKLNPEKWLKI